MPTKVLNLLYATVTTGLHDVASCLLTLGIVIALIAWVGGRSRTATRVRDGWDAATQAARRTRDGYGLDTGRFGHWLYAARVWVRVGVAAVAVLVLWANRPLNVFLIVFTVVIAALVLLLATPALAHRAGARALIERFRRPGERRDLDNRSARAMEFRRAPE